MPKTHYCVVTNMPGYLPDPDGNFYTSSFREARAELKRRAEEFRSDGNYRVTGSQSDEYYFADGGYGADFAIEILRSRCVGEWDGSRTVPPHCEYCEAEDER